jgi:hypothetical protein
MYNLKYTPTTLGVQSWREIISGGTLTKRVEYHCSSEPWYHYVGCKGTQGRQRKSNLSSFISVSHHSAGRSSGRVLFFGIWHRVVRWKSPYVSEEHITSVFRSKGKTRDQSGAGSSLDSCLAYSSIWRWRLYVPPKRLLAFQRTTRCYTPEDTTVHNHRCENIRSYKSLEVCHLHWPVKQPEFKSRPGGQLSSPRLFLVTLSTYRQMPK